MSRFEKPRYTLLRERLEASGPGCFTYDELVDAFRYAEALEKELSEVARLMNVDMLLGSVLEKAKNLQSQAYRGYPEFKQAEDEMRKLKMPRFFLAEQRTYNEQRDFYHEARPLKEKK
jgi:hypothetical protein